MYTFGRAIDFVNSMPKFRKIWMLILLPLGLWAQVPDRPLDSVQEKMIIMEGDSIFRSSV